MESLRSFLKLGAIVSGLIFAVGSFGLISSAGPLFGQEVPVISFIIFLILTPAFIIVDLLGKKRTDVVVSGVKDSTPPTTSFLTIFKVLLIIFFLYILGLVSVYMYTGVVESMKVWNLTPQERVQNSSAPTPQ